MPAPDFAKIELRVRNGRMSAWVDGKWLGWVNASTFNERGVATITLEIMGARSLERVRKVEDPEAVESVEVDLGAALRQHALLRA